MLISNDDDVLGLEPRNLGNGRSYSSVFEMLENMLRLLVLPNPT